MTGSPKGMYGSYKGALGQKERFKDPRHDMVQERKKWPGPTRCPGCGVVVVAGRWSWERASSDAQEATCPACQRIADNYPAGFIMIKGSFLSEHREEVLGLIRNIEAVEKAAHPLERLMGITDENAHTLVTTTGIHLARRIGDALARAYQGDLTLQYGEAEQRIRVFWER